MRPLNSLEITNNASTHNLHIKQVRTFLHADSRITLSIASLPPEQALPGGERGQIWMWMRPKGGDPDAAAVRRWVICWHGYSFIALSKGAAAEPGTLRSDTTLLFHAQTTGCHCLWRRAELPLSRRPPHLLLYAQ